LFFLPLCMVFLSIVCVVHAFIVFLLNMICMHNLFKLSFMFVLHACFLGIEHGYMGAFLWAFFMFWLFPHGWIYMLSVSFWFSMERRVINRWFCK
jgi:hypothetical protein